MGVVCQTCGTENRDKARFCLGCAAPLTPVASSTSRQRRSRSRRARKADADRRGLAAAWAARPVWVVGGAAAVVLVAALVWGAMPSPRPVHAPPGSPTAAAASPAPATAPSSVTTPDPLAEATAAAQARLKASLERLEEKDREREKAHQQELEVYEKRLKEEQTRRREQALAAARARVPEPPPVEQTPVPPPSEPSRPAPAPPPVPAVVAAPVLTVEQRCAGSSNFFSRSICESEACRDASLAQDPVCRRLRLIEQSNRRDPHLLN